MRGLEAQSREKMDFIFYLLLCIYKYDSCGWDPAVQAAELRKESSWAKFLPALITVKQCWNRSTLTRIRWLCFCSKRGSLLMTFREKQSETHMKQRKVSKEPSPSLSTSNKTNSLSLYLTCELSASCDQNASCLDWQGWECWPQLGYAEKAVWDQGSYSSWREWHVFCPYSTLYRSCTFHHWRWTCKRKESAAAV